MLQKQEEFTPNNLSVEEDSSENFSKCYYKYLACFPGEIRGLLESSLHRCARSDANPDKNYKENVVALHGRPFRSTLILASNVGNEHMFRSASGFEFSCLIPAIVRDLYCSWVMGERIFSRTKQHFHYSMHC